MTFVVFKHGSGYGSVRIPASSNFGIDCIFLHSQCHRSHTKIHLNGAKRIWIVEYSCEIVASTNWTWDRRIRTNHLHRQHKYIHAERWPRLAVYTNFFVLSGSNYYLQCHTYEKINYFIIFTEHLVNSNLKFSHTKLPLTTVGVSIEYIYIYLSNENNVNSMQGKRISDKISFWNLFKSYADTYA